MCSKLVNFLRILSTKSNITQKLKIAKIGNLIFDLFQDIAQLFGTKEISALFVGGREHAVILHGTCRDKKIYFVFEPNTT